MGGAPRLPSEKIAGSRPVDRTDDGCGIVVGAPDLRVAEALGIGGRQSEGRQSEVAQKRAQSIGRGEECPVESRQFAIGNDIAEELCRPMRRAACEPADLEDALAANGCALA